MTVNLAVKKCLDLYQIHYRESKCTMIIFDDIVVSMMTSHALIIFGFDISRDVS